jgi:hypothetical protein
MRYCLVAFALFATACSGAPIASSPLAPILSPAPGPSVAALEVSAFTVSRWGNGGTFDFGPTLRLTETSGKSGAWVISLEFHLDDIGAAGNVPAWSVRKRVDAGMTREINPYLGGDYEFWILRRPDAERVSVVISFTDDEGRNGSVSAVTAVSQ